MPCYTTLARQQCVIPENFHTHPTEGHWKFLGGGGVLKAKFLEAMYDNKPEFPRGGGGRGGCKTICFPWVELHNSNVVLLPHQTKLISENVFWQDCIPAGRIVTWLQKISGTTSKSELGIYHATVKPNCNSVWHSRNTTSELGLIV